MNYLLSLLGMSSRVEKANERIATAQEDIASMLESVRDRLRDHLGYTPAMIEEKSETVSKKRTK